MVERDNLKKYIKYTFGLNRILLYIYNKKKKKKL